MVGSVVQIIFVKIQRSIKNAGVKRVIFVNNSEISITFYFSTFALNGVINGKIWIYKDIINAKLFFGIGSSFVFDFQN